MVLTQNKTCQKCNRKDCKELYFDKERKDWFCRDCTSYLKKNEKETEHR